MSDKLPPHFLDLIADALLHSFWRKRSLRAFLRRTGIKESFLSTWHDDGETKRDFIYRLFPFLEAKASDGTLRSLDLQVDIEPDAEVEVSVENNAIVIRAHRYASDDDARAAGRKVVRNRRRLLERLSK